LGRARILGGILLIVASLALSLGIILGSDKLSWILVKAVVSLGVALVGILAGASIILSSRYG